MIDFNKLNSQLDLKNLDADKLSKILIQYQKPFIQLVTIVLTVILVGMIFNDHQAKDKLLRVQISQAQEKLSVVKAREASIANLHDFTNTLPRKINEFDLIGLVSEYAKKCNVNISSISPAESKDMGLYDLINFNFSATADSFKDLMLFLRKIERSQYSLRIDSWSGQKDTDGSINFTILISAVIIHTT